MSEHVSPLERMSQIQDFVDLYDFMEDEEFGQAMELALKCLAKPDLPPAAARTALVKMQAYAFYFKVKGQVYMTIKKGKAGTEDNNKKNVYFSVSEQCHELAQTLKYIAKEHI